MLQSHVRPSYHRRYELHLTPIQRRNVKEASGAMTTRSLRAHGAAKGHFPSGMMPVQEGLAGGTTILRALGESLGSPRLRTTTLTGDRTARHRAFPRNQICHRGGRVLGSLHLSMKASPAPRMQRKCGRKAANSSRVQVRRTSLEASLDQ